MPGHLAKDLTGQIFGYILVKSRAPNQYNPSDVEKRFPRAMWFCECLLCGKEKVIRGAHLKSGRIISCGCVRKERAKKALTKHNKTKTRLYGVWQNIKNRCYNKNVRSYADYGARGIYVCDEWKNDFQSFYSWCINNGYNEDKSSQNYQIDRIDNDGPYAPWNCRFVTAKENANNRRVAKLKDATIYTVFSISATRFEWQKIINTSEYRIKLRSKEWNIPIEMFILYVIERNAGSIKRKQQKIDSDHFVEMVLNKAQELKLDKMTEDELRAFIATSLHDKKVVVE